jgi:hypothetical protein
MDFCLYRSGLRADGTREPWAVYNLLWMTGPSTAHHFARQDRQQAPTDLIAVRIAGTGEPLPAVGQSCSLIEQFCPPYPTSC